MSEPKDAGVGGAGSDAGAGGTGSSADPRRHPLPEGIAEVSEKRQGRRYLYDTEQILCRQEQFQDDEVLAAKILSVADPEPVDSEESSFDQRTVSFDGRTVEDRAAVLEFRRRLGARRRQKAATGAGIATFRLKPENRTIDAVPSIVDEIRAEGTRASKNWYCSPHIIVASADGSGTWGPGGPVDPTPGPMPAPKGHAGKGVTVAVVDTGAHHLHSWLEGNLDEVKDFLDDEVIDEDRNTYVDTAAGHGTFVAGVIRLAAPSARIIVRSAMGSTGLVPDAELAGVLLDLIDLDAEIDILNLSVGAYTHGAGQTGLPQTGYAIRQLRRQRPKLIVVAAAGNDNVSEPFYPAAYNDVLGVGALDAANCRACFSNFGPWVDTWALGVEVVSSWVGPDPKLLNGGGTKKEMARWSGTSFAAPRVAGALAAAMSK